MTMINYLQSKLASYLRATTILFTIHHLLQEEQIDLQIIRAASLINYYLKKTSASASI